MEMTDAEFQARSAEALERLNRSLGGLAEELDFELVLQAGVLTIEVVGGNSGKIIVSPNSSARQVWISALSTSFKLVWTDTAFRYPRTGEELDVLLDRLIRELCTA